MLVLFSFTPNPAIVMGSAGGGGNSAFGVESKSDAISGEKELIPHACVNGNKNENLTCAELVVNLPNLEQKYFTPLVIRQ